MIKKQIYLSAVLLSMVSLTVSASDIETTIDATRLEIIASPIDSQNSVEISLWSPSAGCVLSSAQLTAVSTLKRVRAVPSLFELEHPKINKVIGSSKFSGDENLDLDSQDLSGMNLRIGLIGGEKSFLLEDSTCSLLSTPEFYSYTISLVGKIDLNDLSGSTKNVKCEISRDVDQIGRDDEPNYNKTVIDQGNYLVPITYDFSGIKASPEDSQILSKLRTNYIIFYFTGDEKAIAAAAAGYASSNNFQLKPGDKMLDISLDEVKKVVIRDVLNMDNQYNVMFPISLNILKGGLGEDISWRDRMEKINGNIVDSCKNIRLTPKDGGSRIKFNGTLHAPNAANGQLDPFIDSVSCELIPPVAK